MCSCSGNCNCSVSVPRGPRGIQGPPGETPEITIGTVTTLPAGSDASVVNSGSPLVAQLDFGIPRGAVPTIAIGTVTAIPSGDTPTVTNTGTPTGAIFNFGLPQGTPGANGQSAFTSLTASFLMPAVNSTASITVGSTAWMSLGDWIYVTGAGAAGYAGGWLVVASNALSSTQILVRNPGTTDGISPAEGYPSGLPRNATAGTSVTPSGFLNQVISSARPGPRGADGSTSVQTLIPITNTIPVAAPPAGQETQIYQNDPVTPTIMRVYYYTGGVWTSSGNFVGAPGTLWVNTNGDPNVTLPSGPIGTYAVRTDVLSIYVKTGTTTWTLLGLLTPTFQQVATASAGVFGTVPTYTLRVIGYLPRAQATAGPTYDFDIAFQCTRLDASGDVELGWENPSTFLGTAHYQWEVENTSGGVINLTYAAGDFSKKTGLALPTTLASGATQVFLCYRFGADILIADTFVSVAV